MAKMRVEVYTDSTGRLDKLKIFKRRQRRSVDLQFIYDGEGFVREIQFDGRREDLPSIPEIIDLINEKFMERIGTISGIDEITDIKKGTLTLLETVHQNYTITEMGVLHGEDNTEETDMTGAYVLAKTIAISALNKRAVLQIDFRAKVDPAMTYGFKVTRIIDGGTETTIFEKTTGLTTDYEWYTETFTALEGGLILIKLYLKGEAPASKIYNLEFRVYGTYLKENYEYVP